MSKPNNQINKEYLDTVISTKLRTAILTSIAAHYDCANDVVEEELFSENAEHLLDYMTDMDLRNYAHIQMKELGLFGTTHVPESNTLVYTKD